MKKLLFILLIALLSMRAWGYTTDLKSKEDCIPVSQVATYDILSEKYHISDYDIQQILNNSKQGKKACFKRIVKNFQKYMSGFGKVLHSDYTDVAGIYDDDKINNASTHFARELIQMHNERVSGTRNNKVLAMVENEMALRCGKAIEQHDKNLIKCTGKKCDDKYIVRIMNKVWFPSSTECTYTDTTLGGIDITHHKCFEGKDLRTIKELEKGLWYKNGSSSFDCTIRAYDINFDEPDKDMPTRARYGNPVVTKGK